MKIKWYGHSCFLITADNGVRILTDPCDESTGYILKDIETDIVTSSHDHFDHNYFAAAKGEPIILKDAGETEACGIRFLGVPTWHDKTNGSERGSNIIFVFEVDGMKIAHLGDLGHMPNDAQKAALQDLDILMLPIGGTYTIDTPQAEALIADLKPRRVIAMHFKTEAYSSINIATCDAFAADMKAAFMPREIEITKENIMDLPEVMILSYK